LIIGVAIGFGLRDLGVAFDLCDPGFAERLRGNPGCREYREL